VKLILATFGVAVLSALFPLVNIEVYVAALATQVGPARAIGLALSAGLGQTVGKIVWYVGAAYFMESNWMRKKFTDARWKAAHDRWHTRMDGRPWLSAGILLLSAFVGLPPLLIVAVLAGTLRVPLWVFVPCVLVGRTLRFYLVLVGIEIALS
jgi:membrane protein YqaA with SNARE-associated domain